MTKVAAHVPKDPNYPARKWHPESGASRIFNSESEVPTGWLDHHPDDKEKQGGPAQSEVRLSLTRAEITEALDEGGIKYKQRESTEALHDKLAAAVKAVLTEQEREYDPNASLKDLLELLRKPE